MNPRSCTGAGSVPPFARPFAITASTSARESRLSETNADVVVLGSATVLSMNDAKCSRVNTMK